MLFEISDDLGTDRLDALIAFSVCTYSIMVLILENHAKNEKFLIKSTRSVDKKTLLMK